MNKYDNKYDCREIIVIDKDPYWPTLHLMTPASTFPGTCTALDDPGQYF